MPNQKKMPEARSELEELRAKLKSAEARLAALIDGTGYAFFSVDKEWRFTHLNKLAEYYEKTKKENVVGKKMWEAFPRILNEPFFKKYQEVVKSGKPAEFEAFDDNFWFEAHAIPSEEGLYVFYRDINDRKLLEQRKDEFIRLASHELKTPITALRLYAELIQSEITDPPEVKTYIDKIVDQADKLNELVTELLDLSRIQVGKLHFQTRKMDFVDFAKDALATLQKTSPTHDLVCDIKATKAFVKGDKLRLNQVITNLVNNAIKYSPGKDRVEITINKDRSKVYFMIRDFGIGIPFAFRQKIFTRFYQVPHNNSDTFPGLGIGLYISQAIIAKHGGTVEVESAEGKGSTFTVTLPLYRTKQKNGK